MDQRQEACFQLKADLIPLTVIKLSRPHVADIEQQLKKTLEKAPNYFHQAPVLIDVTDLKDQEAFDVGALAATFRQNQLITVAIRGANASLATRAQQHGIALFNKTALKEQKGHEPSATSKTLTNVSPTKIITKPIRAGTQVYAKGGDLIILAAVNAGAECFADGSIHIYGPLRGRALAGINGDTSARIFCRSLEAELIAIAGHYQVKESIKSPSKPAESMIQIYLENDKIQITAI